MQVVFIAGFDPVVPDMGAARAFYAGALDLPLEGDVGYLHTSQVDGARSFALWPLSGITRSCFGAERRPADLPASRG